MRMAADYRHELKYVVTGAQLAVLRSRIRPLTELDAHTDGDSGYSIRSLYFDDYMDTCYHENENGVDPREKFRIRIYNGRDDVIRLELKQKVRGKTRKESCALSKELCREIIKDGLRWEEVEFLKDTRAASLLARFYVKQETVRLRPKVIVEYEREPYVCRSGNVRITFDTGIRSSAATEGFFDSRIPARPVMPVGYQLMEVKYDEFLPDHIYQALQIGDLSISAFSKYCLCRKFNMGGMMSYGI